MHVCFKRYNWTLAFLPWCSYYSHYWSWLFEIPKSVFLTLIFLWLCRIPCSNPIPFSLTLFFIGMLNCSSDLFIRTSQPQFFVCQMYKEFYYTWMVACGTGSTNSVIHSIYKNGNLMVLEVNFIRVHKHVLTYYFKILSFGEEITMKPI